MTTISSNSEEAPYFPHTAWCSSHRTVDTRSKDRKENMPKDCSRSYAAHAPDIGRICDIRHGKERYGKRDEVGLFDKVNFPFGPSFTA